MKICMVCRQHPRHLCGGLAVAGWNTARAAHDEGLDVTYVTAQRPDGFGGLGWERSLSAGSKRNIMTDIKVNWLEGTSDLPNGYPDFWKALTEQVNPLDYDIIHSQSSGALPFLNKGRPTIFQDHGIMLADFQDRVNYDFYVYNRENLSDGNIKHFNQLYFHNCDLTESETLYLRKYDKILATSQVSYYDILTKYGITSVEKFYHCIYGVKNSVPRGITGKKPVIGFFSVSLDSLSKGVESGLKRLIPFKDDIIIKMIGGGTRSVDIAKKYFPKVIATGYLQEERAIEELKEVDILFECSWHHRGLNLTGLTALGLGIPILCYSTGAHVDMVEGGAGKMLDPLVMDIKAPLYDLINNRLSYSKRAIKRFNNNFTPEVVGKRLRSIYENLKGGGPSRDR